MKGNLARPGALRGIYAIWWRESLVFFRETPRIISAITSPIIWLVIFGAGFGPSIDVGSDYRQFIFAGILVQTFLFSSLFYGAYLVWDRKIDVLKAVLVSPLGRTSIFLGKVLGGVTISLLESVIVLAIGYLLGMQYSPLTALAVLGLIALASAGLTALGLTIGSFMDSPEGFQLLFGIVLFPLFFLSGALFPVGNLEGALGVLSSVNPVTYIVDLLRGTISGVFYFSPELDSGALAIFVVLSNLAGILAFRRMKS